VTTRASGARLVPPRSEMPGLSSDPDGTVICGACSWSGGKDSALALQLAVEQRAQIGALLTMLDESGERSRSHGLPRAVLAAQAAALGVPLVTRAAAWSDHTRTFAAALDELARLRCSCCVFGDVDTEAHRTWCELVCASAGLSATHPLWQRDRRELVKEIINRGWDARIVVVRESVLDRSFLGRRLDWDVVERLDARGVDLCGENGEFHTVVTDGPLFARPLEISADGEFRAGGCMALRLRVSAFES
jgi:diphthine-ammonia ligase